MNTHPTYHSGGSGTYAGTQRKLRDSKGNLTGQTEMVTPTTEKRDAERRERAANPTGTWVDVGGGGGNKMAANTRPQSSDQQPEQAAGFSEALSSYLSQGGGIRRDSKGRTYMKGALKGMTQDEAVEKAKRMWANASPAIREKYAARVQDRPAVSERNNAAQQQPMAAFDQKPRGAGMAAFTRPSGDPVSMQGNRPFAEGNSMLEDEEEEDEPLMSEQTARTVNPRATAGAGRGRAIAV